MIRDTLSTTDRSHLYIYWQNCSILFLQICSQNGLHHQIHKLHINQESQRQADHVILLRCLIQQARRQRQTLYIIAADFDGAFDRISRSVLIRKLILFGAGTIFVSCLAPMYMSTENIIFRGVVYKLFSGIKQGLPHCHPICCFLH